MESTRNNRQGLRPGPRYRAECRTRTSRSNARAWIRKSCLEAMRRRTAAKVGSVEILAANEADAEAVRWQLQRRLASLDDDVAALCFGRIDEESGERWYVGRRHIEDGEGTPVVVDWRAGVATPFYRATLADPFGLNVAAGSCSARASSPTSSRRTSPIPTRSRARAGFPIRCSPSSGERARGRCATSSRRSRPNRTRSSARRSRRVSSCRAVREPARPRSACIAPRSCCTSTGPDSRARACSSSGPTRCSCATSRRSCRRWARRRRPRRRSTVCSRCGSASWATIRSRSPRSRATRASRR